MRNTTVLDGISPGDLGLPDKFQEFRDVQREAVEFALYGPEGDGGKRIVGLGMPVGSGKSLAAQAAGIVKGVRFCTLTATKSLQDQYLEDQFDICDVRGRANYDCTGITVSRNGLYVAADCETGAEHNCKHLGSANCPYTKKVEDANLAQAISTNYQFWMNVRSANINALEKGGQIGMLICDECFPAGTLVGHVPIEKLKVGDEVVAYNAETKEFARQRVSALMKRPAKKLYRLVFSDSTSITCTPNHPLYTQAGWKTAEEITKLGNTVLCLKYPHDTNNHPMQTLQKENNSARQLETLQLSQDGMGDMQQQMRVQMPPAFTTQIQKTNSWVDHTDDQKQPYAESGCQSQNENDSPSNGMETASSRRQWAAADSSSVAFGSGARVANRISSKDIQDTREWVPDALQVGYSEPDSKDRHRAGRSFPQCTSPQNSGSKKGRTAYFVRLESIEVFESRSPERFREVCPDGFVYNIEVENFHTYTANGFIVHNCHKIPDELSRFLDTWVGLEDCFAHSGVSKSQMPWAKAAAESGPVDGIWMAFLVAMTVNVSKQLSAILAQYDGNRFEANQDSDYRRLDKLQRDLRKLTVHGNDGNWIWELTRKGIKFSIIWPWRYAERYLFSGVAKVLLLSGTLRPKLGGLLGIKRSDMDFKEWPRQFPAANGMVYYVPTESANKGPGGVALDIRMSHKMSQVDLDRICARVDEIMETWRGHKGIIHTASYARAEMLQARCKYGRHMVLNQRGNESSTWAADKFRAARLGPDGMCALVSPSYTTGWDFPLGDDEVDSYQIIVKVPYHDQSSPIVLARRSDPDYEVYDIMQTLVQTCGRRNRRPTDKCTTMILDGAVKRFAAGAKTHAPSYFKIFTSRTIPKPRIA